MIMTDKMEAALILTFDGNILEAYFTIQHNMSN